jgi:hypothetical protein
MIRERNDMARALYTVADLTQCEGIACRGRGEAPGHPPKLAAAGTRLCPTCTRHLTDDLIRLPRLYHECGLLLGGSGQRLRERTSGGGSSPGLPFNTAAADARTAILGVLRSWAGLVVEERAVTAPRDTVAAVAEFLTRHTEWLAAHEAVAELSAEIARAVRRARHVIDPSRSQGMRIGACPAADCQGTLTAAVRSDQADTRVAISCTAVASHRWSAQEWMALDRGTPADPAEQPAVPQPAAAAAPVASAVRWLSAKDISLLWAIPTGSVYRHASEQQWRRRTGKGRTFYHGHDVLQSLGTRTGARP